MATIIFDFDGTIADSFDYVSDFLAREAGKAPLSPEEKKQLRGLSMSGMARKLGYPMWRQPWLFLKGRARMHKTIRNLNPFAGMAELIRKLHSEGHELFIVSANSTRNVKSFAHKQKIDKYFVEIYGNAGFFNKAPALRGLIKRQNLEMSRAVYIGDEQRDVEAAKAADMKAIAVSWGFASRDNLKALKPTALADTPAELMRVLEEF